MTLRNSMTINVTHDLLTRIITLLSSASKPLSTTQISDLVTERLAQHSKFRYMANNDLGLCVERLLSACDTPKMDSTALHDQYPVLCQDDEMVVELMNQMASGISAQLTTPLYDLRIALPKEANEMAATITSRIPEAIAFSPAAELQQFSWGKLNSESVRSTAMLFAQDRLHCFKKDTIQSYDTDKILHALPFGDNKAIPNDATIRPLLVTALETASPENNQHALVADIILSPIAYRKWALTVRATLTEKNLGASVVAVTTQIDAIENLLQTVSASMLTNVGADSSTVADNILHNIETISANIKLLRAAMIWPKDKALADRLLLTPRVVQKSVLDQFVLDGGTENMIHDYLSYIQLNDHITIPPTGQSAETIRSMHPRTEKMVREKSALLQERAAASRATALQNTLVHYLDQYNETMLKSGKHAAKYNTDTHEAQRQRSLVLLPQKPLEDIALEYLVAMRDNPMTKTLFKAVNAELTVAVKQHTDIGKVEVAQATCAAVVDTVLAMLTKRFATKLAA